MRRAWLLGMLCATGLVGVLVWPKVDRWLDVDVCLDGGGVYIHDQGRCPHDQAEIDAYKKRKAAAP